MIPINNNHRQTEEADDLESLQLIEAILESEADIREGRTQSADEALDELRRELGISD